MNQPQVRVEEIAQVPVAVIRRQARRGDLPRLVTDLCGRVWAELRRQGIHGGRNVAIYRDGSILVEAGAECADAFTEHAEVERAFLPSGKTLVALHVGPYQSLRLAHEAVLAYAREHQLKLAGPSWERYGHWRKEWDAHPDRIETEVAYQIG